MLVDIEMLWLYAPPNAPRDRTVKKDGTEMA
jgi:hypothetical protein